MNVCRRPKTINALRLIDGLGFEVASVTPAAARRVTDAHTRWGHGVDPARLKFGDCFAYALAFERNAPLLDVGDDFARTDVPRTL